MGSLDDLPNRSGSHELDDAAQLMFEAALDPEQFFVQAKDRRDYGTDYQLEALREAHPTNLRVQVQLKGTDRDENAGGTVSIPVERTNLNYLLAQPHSIYVCFHRPSGRLLARYATDVFQEYERRSPRWQDQDTITVVFAEAFDSAFQGRLCHSALASGHAARDERMGWLATPPERLGEALSRTVPRVEVPTDTSAARELLQTLYEEGQDAVISRAFDSFEAVLGDNEVAFVPAYMAEINLGINDHVVDKRRVLAGIECFRAMADAGGFHVGSLLYSQGNGWLALEEYERAREAYLAALVELGESPMPTIEARCSKNLGTVLHHLGSEDAARAHYERALEIDPDLPEGHFALGVALLRGGEDLDRAIEHLDLATTSQRRGKIPSSAVTGWKVEALFRTGRHREAFSLANVLLAEADRSDWIWPTLARQVAANGHSSPESAKKALRFWELYCAAHPEHLSARRESLLCHRALHMAGEAEIDFRTFRARAVALIDDGVADPAFLWDRVGHWAQENGDWSGAEEAFRSAWQQEPFRYGYCLGTALNFLGRFEEALPVLQVEADLAKRDAMSWFQIGVANDGLKDWPKAIEAFERSVSLDEEYALAWFNLGGAHLNAGQIVAAFEVWSTAIEKFPDHELAQRVREDFLGGDAADYENEGW